MPKNEAALKAALEVQTVHAAVIHKIEKLRAGNAAVMKHPTGHCLDVTDQVKGLVARLHSLYARQTGKSYGQFEGNQDNFPSSKHVANYYLHKAMSFYDLSIALMDILKGRMDNTSATGGYVLMVHISHGVADWFLVAMLTDVAGAAINESLEVIDSIHLDLSHLRVAGRVNLTAWQSDEPRYISFLRGKQELSEYFQNFLGCDNAVKPAQETRKLIDVLSDFADKQELDEKQRDIFTRDAHDFCADCALRGEPVSFESLANRIWPDEPEALQSHLSNPALELSDHFIPDRRVLKSLVKFKAKTDYWSLEFDRKAILSGEIGYNKGMLTIKNIPIDLQLRLENEIDDDGQA